VFNLGAMFATFLSLKYDFSKSLIILVRFPFVHPPRYSQLWHLIIVGNGVARNLDTLLMGFSIPIKVILLINSSAIGS
jgi:hypothetical protein